MSATTSIKITSTEWTLLGEKAMSYITTNDLQTRFCEAVNQPTEADRGHKYIDPIGFAPLNGSKLWVKSTDGDAIITVTGEL